MVDLGLVTPVLTGGSIGQNASKTVNPFTTDITRVLVITAHNNQVPLRSITLVTNGTAYKVVEGTSISVTVTSTGDITITNNSTYTVQYAIVT